LILINILPPDQNHRTFFQLHFSQTLNIWEIIRPDIHQLTNQAVKKKKITLSDFIPMPSANCSSCDPWDGVASLLEKPWVFVH